MDKDEIFSKWNKEEPIFNKLGSEVAKFLKNEILRHEIYPEVSYRTKDLLSIVKKIERKSKVKKYSFDDLKDKLGVRVICSFSSHLDEVDKIIKTFFKVHHAEYKRDELDYDKLDYTSNHYDLSIDKSKIVLKDVDKYQDLIFELQVRSINQHAWSSSAHILTYKKEAEIPKKLQRRVYRLLSLYEIADDEFSSIDLELKEKENSIAYQFIRKLEGKVYKYAKVDFDRNISIHKVKTLLEKFDYARRESISEKVLEYVNENDKKLENIFNNYSNEFYKYSYLTQPEIFLIFYMLDNYPSTLEDIFINDLDNDELEKIKGIWV